jgi:hypothetical protein
MIKRVRDLAVACAGAYVESRERMGHPLLAGARLPPAAEEAAPAAASPAAEEEGHRAVR